MTGSVLHRVLKVSVMVACGMAAVLLPGKAASGLGSTDIRIGVLAKRGETEARRRWEPLARYLDHALPRWRFYIIPLSFDRVRPAVRARQVDFVLVNPSLYVDLEMNYGVSAVATMKYRWQGGEFVEFGSVIFTRSDRQDIGNLGDLRGKRLMVVDEDSLGGFQAAALELVRAGIALPGDVSRLESAGTHDAVVYAVRNGEADAGVVRTGILERMAEEGKIRLSAFKVLGRRGPPRTATPPFLRSTPLYPEWPIAKTPHVGDGVARKVAVALMALSASDPAAREAGIAGWTVPSSYQRVHLLLRELRMGPHARPLVRLTMDDIVRDHGPMLGAGILVLLSLTAVTARAVRVNRQLALTRDALYREVRSRKKAEMMLIADRDALEAKVRERTREMERLRLYDAVTSFPNYLLFCDRVDHVIARGAGVEPEFGIVVFEVGNLQDINDSFGHFHGEMVLSEVGERMRHGFSAPEALAHLGAGRFAAYGAPVETVARELMGLFDDPVTLDGRRIHLTVPMGGAVFRRDGTDTDTLLRRAESAMFHAKRLHRRLAWYEPAFEQFAKERVVLASELREAIISGGLKLVYQPKVDLASGALQGVEALVRWVHPEHGEIPPGRFIPVAEESGLIVSLTQWVLNEALRQCRRWRDAGFEVPVAVNFSMWDVQDSGTVARLDDMVQAWGVPPEFIEIEITESAMMLDQDIVKRVLMQLHDLGMTIAIDDFGAGHSSLSYIRRLPVDRLKIDRAFIRDLPESADSAIIVKTMIQMAHNLGLEVVAEGVEGEPAVMFLQGAGCDAGQGYYFAPPLPPGQIVARYCGGRVASARA